VDAAILAAIAALAGVALGRVLDLWTTSKTWAREHRSIAYAAYLGAVEQYISGVLLAKGNSAYRGSAQGLELDRIHGDVQVFGSEAARIAADRVRESLLKLHLVSPGAPTVAMYIDAAEPAVAACRNATDALRAIMKRELHIR
jgi:hypothetical protein